MDDDGLIFGAVLAVEDTLWAEKKAQEEEEEEEEEDKKNS